MPNNEKLNLLLLAKNEVRWGENGVFATVDQVDGSGVEQRRHLGGAGRSDAKKLEGPDHGVRDQTANVGHAETRKGVRAAQGSIPWDFVGGMLVAVQVEVINNFEARVLERLDDLVRGDQGGKTVADLNTFLDADVILVVGVVAVQHHPLKDAEKTALLQDLVHAREALNAVRGVAGSFDGVSNIEVLSRELLVELLEITLVNLAKVIQAVGNVVLGTNAHLVLVDGNTFDVSTGEDGDVAHRAADTASNVQGTHTVLETKTKSEVVLGSLDGFQEGLVVPARTEVEALAPAPFVEVSHQVVKVVNHGRIASAADVDGLLVGDSTHVLASTSEHVLVVVNGSRELVTLQRVIRVVQDSHTTAQLVVEVLAISLQLSLAEDPQASQQGGGSGDTDSNRVLLHELGGLGHDLVNRDVLQVKVVHLRSLRTKYDMIRGLESRIFLSPFPPPMVFLLPPKKHVEWSGRKRNGLRGDFGDYSVYTWISLFYVILFAVTQ